MDFSENRKNLIFWWLITTIVAIFCLYWESRLYSYLSHFVDQIESCAPYDPLFHYLPVINLYGLIKIGLPLTFLLGLIGLFKKFHQLPYYCFMSALWWLGRWTCMISVVFAVPPDRPPISQPSGFFLSDWLNRTIPDGILSYGQTFMFSGHVGLPFFFACLFYSDQYPFLSKKWWQENWLSVTFFCWSLIQGITAILSRSHYTIDVIAAWGITYSLYALGKIIFKPVKNLGEQLKSTWGKK